MYTCFPWYRIFDREALSMLHNIGYSYDDETDTYSGDALWVVLCLVVERYTVMVSLNRDFFGVRVALQQRKIRAMMTSSWPNTQTLLDVHRPGIEALACRLGTCNHVHTVANQTGFICRSQSTPAYRAIIQGIKMLGDCKEFKVELGCNAVDRYEQECNNQILLGDWGNFPHRYDDSEEETTDVIEDESF